MGMTFSLSFWYPKKYLKHFLPKEILLDTTILSIFTEYIETVFFLHNDSVVLTRVFSHRSYISEKRMYQKFISKVIYTRINFITSLLLIEKMDIRDFLNRSNTKRDLSSSSKEDDEPKRQREESADVSCLDSPTSPGNVFAESLKSNGCVEILMNCLKNLEKEVKE